MKGLFYLFLIIFASLSGCNGQSVTRGDVRALAMEALEESVKLQLGGGDTSIWKTTDVSVDEVQPVKFNGDGRARLPVTVTVKGSTLGCAYNNTPGSIGYVVYETIDNELSIQIHKIAPWKVGYRVLADRSRIVSTTRFACGGADQKIVKGIVTQIDARGCSLILSTNNGLISAALPNENIADLLAEKYQPGLAVSMYVDQVGHKRRAFYIEPE